MCTGAGIIITGTVITAGIVLMVGTDTTAGTGGIMVGTDTMVGTGIATGIAATGPDCASVGAAA